MAISDKLTYLNTTKTKIREGLNSLGADLDTQDTFRSYADAIDEIYEDYPKITGEGTDLSLDNTKQASMQIVYKGNTSQTGTPTPSSPIPVNVVSGDNEIVVCGKNLLPQDKYIATTTKNGITLTNNGDGTFNLSGTANANTTIEIVPNGSLQLEANQSYYLYSSVPYNGTTFNMSIPMTDNGTTKFLLANNTYTPTTTPTNERLQFYIASGQSVNQTNIKLMLVKGSTAPTTYEPYQGNTYNIDLPVENLWGGFSNSFSRTDLGVQFTANQDGTITANGTATNTATSILLSEATSNGIYKTLQKGTYTVSGGGAKYNVEVYDKNNVVRLAGIAPNSSSASFTISDTTNVVLRVQVASGVTINETIKLQLEKSSKANTYTPYGTTPIELCKIGDYKDYFGKSTGKNLWHFTSEALYSVNSVSPTIINENTLQLVSTSNTYANALYLLDLPNGSYTFSLGRVNNSNSSMTTKRMSLVEVVNGTITVIQHIDEGTTYTTTITNESGKRYGLRFWATWNTALVNTATFNEIQIEKGTQATTYEPYGVGKWYLHKEVGKAILDGTENWNISNTGTSHWYYICNIASKLLSINFAPFQKMFYSNQYINNEVTNVNTITGFNLLSSATITNIRIRELSEDTVDNFKTRISSNNIIVYGPLKTPTNTEITDTTLIEQLEESKLSYISQTNISQTNNDLPFILNVKALRGE